METQAITKTFPLYSLLPSGVLPSSRILGHNNLVFSLSTLLYPWPTTLAPSPTWIVWRRQLPNWPLLSSMLPRSSTKLFIALRHSSPATKLLPHLYLPLPINIHPQPQLLTFLAWSWTCLVSMARTLLGGASRLPNSLSTTQCQRRTIAHRLVRHWRLGSRLVSMALPERSTFHLVRLLARDWGPICLFSTFHQHGLPFCSSSWQLYIPPLDFPKC